MIGQNSIPSQPPPAGAPLPLSPGDDFVALSKDMPSLCEILTQIDKVQHTPQQS